MSRVERRREKRELKYRVSACHAKVRDVARGICEASYEDLMSANNELYLVWKKQNPELHGLALTRAFVEKNWSKYIDAARTTMARMLTEPLDEAMKEEIQEALALDSTLMHMRRNPSVVVGGAENLGVKQP